MAFSIPKFSIFATSSPNIGKGSNFWQPFVYFPQSSETNRGFCCGCTSFRCSAAAKQQKSDAAPVTKKKKKPSSRNSGKILVEDDFKIEKSGSSDGVELLESPSQSSQSSYVALPLPKPPAGFLLDEQGRVVMVSDKRIATIVDSSNNSSLECVIRRVFRNSHGDECLLLCPVDTPVQILKSVNIEGWSAVHYYVIYIAKIRIQHVLAFCTGASPRMQDQQVSDEEVEAILPNAAYALAKIHMHLVYSGFCYTARGGFCYTEEDIFEFHMDTSGDIDGLPTEGIEIACFHMDGAHYMIYTPSDPLLFVAVRDINGALQIADDELLEDPAIISAIDEETEFNALVEEEAALFESLIGKR